MCSHFWRKEETKEKEEWESMEALVQERALNRSIERSSAVFFFFFFLGGGGRVLFFENSRKDVGEDESRWSCVKKSRSQQLTAVSFFPRRNVPDQVFHLDPLSHIQLRFKRGGRDGLAPGDPLKECLSFSFAGKTLLHPQGDANFNVFGMVDLFGFWLMLLFPGCLHKPTVFLSHILLVLGKHLAFLHILV